MEQKRNWINIFLCAHSISRRFRKKFNYRAIESRTRFIFTWHWLARLCWHPRRRTTPDIEKEMNYVLLLFSIRIGRFEWITFEFVSSHLMAFVDFPMPIPSKRTYETLTSLVRFSFDLKLLCRGLAAASTNEIFNWENAQSQCLMLVTFGDSFADDDDDDRPAATKYTRWISHLCTMYTDQRLVDRIRAAISRTKHVNFRLFEQQQNDRSRKINCKRNCCRDGWEA